MPHHVGTTIVLWYLEYRTKDAYRDQIGRAHGGYLTYEEIPVRIIEVRTDVPGMFFAGKHEGYRAIAEDGRTFSLNWTSYPDDVLSTPTRWNPEFPFENTLKEFVDAAFFYNHCRQGYPCVTKEGTRAIPKSGTVEICRQHDFAHRVDEECWECHLASIRPVQTTTV